MTRLTRLLRLTQSVATAIWAWIGSLVIATVIAGGIAMLGWALSFVPAPWDEMVRDDLRFAFLVLLVWIVRRGLEDRRELKEHRREIVDSLNHRLADLENLKVTAEALEEHNAQRARDLVEATGRLAERTMTETKRLAEQVAEETRKQADAANKAAEESRKRHEQIGEKLDRVIRDKATKAVTEETHELVKDLADKPKE